MRGHEVKLLIYQAKKESWTLFSVDMWSVSKGGGGAQGVMSEGRNGSAVAQTRKFCL